MSALDRVREMAAVTGPKVVTAAHSAAATAGTSAFSAGGNAFDAALAACFMETVALPMKAGLFGDLIALFRAGGGDFTSLVSVGAGPSGLAKGSTLERVGPRSVGIPGAPHGYAMLHGFARLGLERLIAPAVAASKQGLAWTRVAHSYVVEAAATLAKLSPGNPYAPNGRIPYIGEMRRLPGLGHLLEAFARDREDVFEGPLGRNIIEELTRRGGILVADDLKQRPARQLAPIRSPVAPGAELTVTPHPTYGYRLVDVVRKALTSEEPLPQLIRADRQRAHGQGRLATDDGTSVVAAADDEGNAVIILHSNSFPQFASGIVLDDGLILNNRPGRGFDLDAPPNAANAPRAGRVPPTTLHAWCLQADGKTLLGATPGGVNQLPWNVQTIAELIGGAAPSNAVTSPRWALDASDVLVAEDGAMTGNVAIAKHLAPLSLRSGQQIIRLCDDGAHEAAADPRSGCVALAAF
ncbi:MAG TPA: gamma-glutamyltransferase [Bradyrhizobium sp.]|jgi:gamma-glutamyltranspeptidase/glutathione hydrolase|nr:gamma-glutamyltransferase [Bradyrhizobium sp.]